MHDKQVQEIANLIIDSVKGETLPMEIEMVDFEIPHFKVVYLYNILRRAGYWMQIQYGADKKANKMIIKHLEKK